jgi:hypothetical protein
MRRLAGAQTWIALTGLAYAALTPIGCSREPDYTFASPEAAMQRLEELLGTDRVPEEVLGPGSRALVSSGDAEADHEDALRVKALIKERVEFEDYGENAKIAFLGKDDWPLPFPLVESEGRWRFDVAAGGQELLNRRVGRNELLVLETLHAVVDAQREYFAQGIGGTQAYALKFNSTPGYKDGLYWPVSEGEAESPLGPFVAQASIGDRDPRAERMPFRGYYFRMLTGQGETAPGGTRSYFGPGGRMTLGFAVVAWPAKYGNSGIMTFQVNESGMVFQKDLGKATSQAAAGITTYSPDATWDPTPD